MKRRKIDDPYRAAIRRLNREGIRYVVIGMSGINYYASTPAEAFATLDYDIFIEPTLKNVRQAIDSLATLGFTIGTSSGVLAPESLREIVQAKRTLVATTPAGAMIELLLQVSGLTFSDLAKDAATFTVRGVPVRVGRLTKLLRSKKLADRPKDRAFLKRYEALLSEEGPH